MPLELVELGDNSSERVVMTSAASAVVVDGEGVGEPVDLVTLGMDFLAVIMVLRRHRGTDAAFGGIERQGKRQVTCFLQVEKVA